MLDRVLNNAPVYIYAGDLSGSMLQTSFTEVFMSLLREKL